MFCDGIGAGVGILGCVRDSECGVCGCSLDSGSFRGVGFCSGGGGASCILFIFFKLVKYFFYFYTQYTNLVLLYMLVNMSLVNVGN